jgi:phage terminase small subunit
MPKAGKRQVKVPAHIRAELDGPLSPHWQKHFLDHLAESSNVTASAKAAGATPSLAYLHRRQDTEFARAWMFALYEGYLHLEMEVLRRLREGDLHTEGKEKFDFANALRLLGAHRDNAARVQAEQRNVSAAEVRASIDRKVEAIRAQVQREKQRKAKGE